MAARSTAPTHGGHRLSRGGEGDGKRRPQGRPAVSKTIAFHRISLTNSLGNCRAVRAVPRRVSLPDLRALARAYPGCLEAC